MLQLIAATLSLLLLAGMFGRAVDDEQDESTTSADTSVADTPSSHCDEALSTRRADL